MDYYAARGWKCQYVENTLFRSLFYLFLSKQVYDLSDDGDEGK